MRTNLVLTASICVLSTMICYAVNPACECVVYQSYGRSQGTFTSPNFPQVYPPNVNCILYTFIADLDEIVELTFLEFDLKMKITNKCTDFLRFFVDLERPEVNERHTWKYEECGNITMIQKKHYSSSRSLILEFHTDSFQANHTGFRGRFKFIDKTQFEQVGGTIRWGSTCTYDFYSDHLREGMVPRFFSPGYPQNYPPDQRCQYVFYGRPGERVRVTFQNIQLEDIDGSCTNSPDSIIVRDGVDSSKPVIAQYCNTLNSEKIISSGKELYIEFIVDGKKQRQGFAATFSFIKAGQLPHPKPPNDSTMKPEIGYNTVPGDGPHINYPTVPTTRPMTQCRFHYVSSVRDGPNGTFTSPQYPQPYPTSQVCKYTFHGQGKERVQLKFEMLDLHYPQGDPADPYDCEDVDSVMIMITVSGEPREIGVYCGSKLPPLLMSNNNQMEVVFTTHSSRTTHNSLGFRAHYSFVTDFGISDGAPSQNSVCGFEYRATAAENGTFTSPNFPGLYPRGTECHYLFYGLEGDRVHITFPYFDVEGIPPACVEATQSDYVEFSNFFKTIDRKMSRLCGSSENKQQPPVVSDSHFFRVTFKSNNVYDATGFQAHYQFRSEQSARPEIKHRQSGEINSGVLCHSRTGYFLSLLLLFTSFYFNTIFNGHR